MSKLNLKDPTKDNYIEISKDLTQDQLIKRIVQADNNILATIIATEGLRTKAYRDGANNIHIGVGYNISGKTNQEIRNDMKAIGVSNSDIRKLISEKEAGKLPTLELSQAQALELAQRYIDKFEKQVGKNIKDWDNISEAGKSALIHKAYNVGPNGLPKSFVQAIKEGKTADLEREALVTYRQSFNVDGLNVKVRTPDLRNAYISVANLDKNVLSAVLANTAELDKASKAFRDDLNSKIQHKLEELAKQGKLEDGKLYSLKDLGLKIPPITKLSEMNAYKAVSNLDKSDVKTDIVNDKEDKAVVVKEQEVVNVKTTDSSLEREVEEKNQNKTEENIIDKQIDKKEEPQFKIEDEMKLMDFSEQNALTVKEEKEHSVEKPLSEVVLNGGQPQQEVEMNYTAGINKDEKQDIVQRDIEPSSTRNQSLAKTVSEQVLHNNRLTQLVVSKDIEMNYISPIQQDLDKNNLSAETKNASYNSFSRLESDNVQPVTEVPVTQVKEVEKPETLMEKVEKSDPQSVAKDLEEGFNQSLKQVNERADKLGLNSNLTLHLMSEHGIREKEKEKNNLGLCGLTVEGCEDDLKSILNPAESDNEKINAQAQQNENKKNDLLTRQALENEVAYQIGSFMM